jgi:CRP-like cAMP-binding protein
MLEDPFATSEEPPTETPTEARQWMYQHGDIGLRRLLAAEVGHGERRTLSSEHRRRLRLLRTVPLFQEVPAKDLWPLVDALEALTVPAGEKLFQEGEPGDCLYLISAGRVGVFRGGRRIATKGARDSFGETAVLSGRPRTATVLAEENVELLRLKSEDFYEALFDRTELALQMIRLLSRRLRGEIDLQFQAGGAASVSHPPMAGAEIGSQAPFHRGGTGTELISQVILRRVLVLQKIKLFSQLSQDALVRLAHRVDEVRYAAGEAICRIGEHGDTMYGIIEGKIRVHRGEAEIGLLGEGQYFGEMAIVDSGPRAADCTAVEPALLLRLHRDEAFTVCFQQINVLKGMISVLGERLRTMETWEERLKQTGT